MEAKLARKRFKEKINNKNKIKKKKAFRFYKTLTFNKRTFKKVMKRGAWEYVKREVCSRAAKKAGKGAKEAGKATSKKCGKKNKVRGHIV